MKALVLGAGVDAALKMPLTCELLPRLTEFLNTEQGRALDLALRSRLPRLNFNFDNFIKKTIDGFADEFSREMVVIREQINSELTGNTNLLDSDRKMGLLILRIMDKMINIREATNLDEETEQLIQEVLGLNFPLTDDSIIDHRHIIFTETFKTVLREILTRSLSDSNHIILQHIYRNLLDIEELLLKYFLGFYQQKESYMKTYIYISWVLWAYLVSEEKRISEDWNDNYDELPVYKYLRDNNEWRVINFNYTTFANQFTSRNAISFHGCLTDYADIESKIENYINEEDYTNIDIVDFFKDNISQNIDFISTTRKYTIPSFLPPIKIKPVINSKFIEWWYSSEQILTTADKIIIVGYSFNASDEHFNSILRKCLGKEIIVIDPNPIKVRDRLAAILDFNVDRVNRSLIQEKEVYSYRNVKIISANAEEININEL